MVKIETGYYLTIAPLKRKDKTFKVTYHFENKHSRTIMFAEWLKERKERIQCTCDGLIITERFYITPGQE